MALGRVGSYITDKPVQDSIQDALKYTEQMGFKYREEEDKKKEKETALKAAKEKDLELPDTKVTYTPFSSDNAMRMDLATKCKNKITESANLVRLGKMSQQEFNLIKSNVMGAIDFANQGATNINTQVTNIAKLASEGKLAKGSEEEALKLGGAYENRQVNFEGNPDGTFNTVTFDKDGKTVLAREGLDKIGSSMYNPVLNVDYDVELQQFKTANPIDFTETLSGLTKTGVKELTPRLKGSINNYAEAKLKNKDALINAYYNATGEFKKDITSEGDIAKAKKYIVDKFEQSYNKEITKDEATGRANYGLAKKESEKDEIKIKSFKFDNVRIDDFTKNPISPNTVYTNGISFTKPIKISNLGGANSDLNAVEVLGVTKDKKTGNIIFTGKALKTKNAKFTVGGKKVDFPTAQELANSGNEEAKLALSSYSVASNMGNFTRRIESEDEANAVLGQANLDVNSANYQIEKMNPNVRKESPKKQVSNSNKPKQVVQNGITYTLNPSTGEYE